MAQQVIYLGGAANDGTGDPARTAGAKINENFTELYSSVSGLQTALDTLNNGVVAASTKTANYTLVLGDAGDVVEFNSASNLILTVPPNSGVAFPIGTTIEVCGIGTGTVTLAPGSGVTFRNPGTSLVLRAQWSSATLRKRATDEWVLAGDFA